MKNILIAITLGLTLTACGGDDTPPEKEMSQKELVAAAAAGNKGAIGTLERQVAKKAKADKKKMDAPAGNGDPIAAFQKLMTSGDATDERISALADTGNPNAIYYRAIMSRYNSNLSPEDRDKHANELIEIAASGDKYKNHEISGGNHPLSAEAAFYISQDKFFKGELFDKDHEGSLKYLQQAVESGHAKAMLKLSTNYQFGFGVDKDLVAAKSWLEKSAAAGNHDAKRALKNLEK